MPSRRSSPASNRAQSGIRTRSYKSDSAEDANILRFEDKKGDEEVMLHSQKDLMRRDRARRDPRSVQNARDDHDQGFNDVLTLNKRRHHHQVRASAASRSKPMQSITLKVGQNTIVLDQAGITLKGMTISEEAKLHAQDQVADDPGKWRCDGAGAGRHRDAELTMSATLTKLQRPVGAAPAAPRARWVGSAGAVAGRNAPRRPCDRLETAGRQNDAVRLAAHALPKREAVWWACMCARAVIVADLPGADAACARSRREPGCGSATDDAVRRAAWERRPATDFRSPEAWAAVGAFWSGGSMSPEGQPVVPPADHLTGVAVSGAVVLASVRGRPERARRG